jgi:hypothetical protein
METFLDHLPPIDWRDFERASETSKRVLHKLAGDGDLLRALVHRVEEAPRLLEMAEHHQLLDRMVIYDALDRGFRIRLHLTTDEHHDRPHDHRFSFSTLILRGGYRHIWHAPGQEVGEGMDVARLRPLFVTTEAQGACYTLHHSALHTTFTTPDTVSLFIRGPAEKQRSVITDKRSGKLWWRYGESDETAERRSEVQMSAEGYRKMRARLEVLGVLR